MKKLFKLINAEIKKNKKLSTFIIVLLIIGLITGSLFITILNNADKLLIKETITNYFEKINIEKINFLNNFRTSVVPNLLYVSFIWLLGISILGIPIILFLIFVKSFILGFSISSIIFTYKFGGTLLSLSYIFPHHIINIINISFLGLYSLKVSLSLLKLIISKKQINFKLIIKKYIGVLIISIILTLLSSLIETFITPYFINIFNFIIK